MAATSDQAPDPTGPCPARPAIRWLAFLEAKILSNEGRWAEASQAFEQASDVVDEPYVHIEYARMLLRLAQFSRPEARRARLDEAAAEAEAALRSAPGNLDVLRVLAEVRIEQSAVDPAAIPLARQAMLALLAASPSDLQAALTAAQLALVSREPAEALRILDVARASRPRNPALADAVVEALRHSARVSARGPAADAAFETALRERLKAEPEVLEFRLALVDHELDHLDPDAAHRGAHRGAIRTANRAGVPAPARDVSAIGMPSPRRRWRRWKAPARAWRTPPRRWARARRHSSCCRFRTSKERRWNSRPSSRRRRTLHRHPDRGGVAAPDRGRKRSRSSLGRSSVRDASTKQPDGWKRRPTSGLASAWLHSPPRCACASPPRWRWPGNGNGCWSRWPPGCQGRGAPASPAASPPSAVAGGVRRTFDRHRLRQPRGARARPRPRGSGLARARGAGPRRGALRRRGPRARDGGAARGGSLASRRPRRSAHQPGVARRGRR